ncbi:MAG: MMPL family transporter, partial [Desulfatitalea sp.]|nr:MMPL family transporter [Desulfatitalea sp.]NNK01764.1 MMPL family transporter [Desulfatitalea sp.]
MQKQHSIFSGDISQKLQEAELYLNHRLFQESRDIYTSLLKEYRGQTQDTMTNGIAKGSDINPKIQFLEHKLNQIDQMESDFTHKRKLVKGRTSFQQGIVLPNLGLHDAPVNEFEQEEESYEETAFLNEGDHIVVNDAGAKDQKPNKAVSVLKNLLTFNISIVCERPWHFLTASVLIAVFFMAFIPGLKLENNVDFFFDIVDDPSRKIYDEIREVFGNDEFFVIAFEKEDIFTKKNLTLIRNITDDLEALEAVRDITSITNVNDTIGEKDYFEVRQFIEDIPESREELEALKRRAVGKPMYAMNIISPDARTAAIVVSTHQRPQDPNYRQNLLAKTKEILSQHNHGETQFYLTGWASINVSFIEFQNRDIKIFVPLTYLLIPLVVFYFFRNIRLVLLAIANISVCLGATMGMFSLT